MSDLNVETPDAIVRVSEYVDEVIAFIEKIIKNGFAYESEGNVYFSVNKFHNTNNHCYAKMEPQNIDN